jgi:hypothetical protein
LIEHLAATRSASDVVVLDLRGLDEAMRVAARCSIKPCPTSPFAPVIRVIFSRSGARRLVNISVLTLFGL